MSPVVRGTPIRYRPIASDQRRTNRPTRRGGCESCPSTSCCSRRIARIRHHLRRPASSPSRAPAPVRCRRTSRPTTPAYAAASPGAPKEPRGPRTGGREWPLTAASNPDGRTSSPVTALSRLRLALSGGVWTARPGVALSEIPIPTSFGRFRPLSIASAIPLFASTPGPDAPKKTRPPPQSRTAELSAYQLPHGGA